MTTGVFARMACRRPGAMWTHAPGPTSFTSSPSVAIASPGPWPETLAART